MKGRERFLTALSNKKPDRLPCQVHSFMPYFLVKNMLLGNLRAYKYFGMDPVLYLSPQYRFTEQTQKNWRTVRRFKSFRDGVYTFEKTIVTPKGNLTTEVSVNKYTVWNTRPLIKTDADFELFKEFYPVPVSADWKRINKAKAKIGDSGIVRMVSRGYGQSGAFQSLANMMDTVNLIYKVYDEPDWVHYALEVINNKNIETVYNCGKIEADLVETGGGAGSSTVISPDIHKEFCLPYDKKLHKAIKDNGGMVTYHLCGGLMPLLETVAENGADALETMTPAGMGGDCVLKQAAERIGDKMAFIGGLDQNAFFEKGTPETVRAEVRRLFESKPQGGYVCSPSDHFFHGKKENIKAFADACKECVY
jgi:uroporphyrinogen-III decarboxylase